MSAQLSRHKFSVLQNPNGILFTPLSVAKSLNDYAIGRQYEADELFYLNELWNSWDHHTSFSNFNQEAALAQINKSLAVASNFLESAGWVIITLGSSFQYFLKKEARAVANNHRAPQGLFEKRLLEVETMTAALSASIQKIREKNLEVKFIFTVSPVRHVRDGVVENNRSKARLIETVHRLCEEMEDVFYFPAYEMVIDVLRDYRFYDIDLVHPNYLATQMVWEHFVKTCMAPETILLMKEVKDIMTAVSHRPRFPATVAHGAFLKSYRQKVKNLLEQYPFLDLAEELAYFGG